MLALFVLLAALSNPSRDLDVTVVDKAGRPLADAVVMVHVPGVAPPTPASLAWPARMEQRNLRFDPHVLIVAVGSDVAFPNRDSVRHHVYSFSKGNRFELKLFGKEDARTVTLSTPGTVAIGCNIHDQMAGYIHVVDTPFVAQTNAAGVARLEDVPAVASTLTIWHKDLGRARDDVSPLAPAANTVTRTLSVASAEHAGH